MGSKSKKVPSHWPADLKRELSTPIAGPELFPDEALRKLGLVIDHLIRGQEKPLDSRELLFQALLKLCQEMFPGFTVKPPRGPRVRTLFSDVELIYRMRHIMGRDGVGIEVAVKRLQRESTEYSGVTPDSLKTRYHEAKKRADVAPLLQALERLPSLFVRKGKKSAQ
jgi:hypothetical protein